MRESASTKRWEVPEHRGYPPTIPHTPTLTSASTPSQGGRGQALYIYLRSRLFCSYFTKINSCTWAALASRRWESHGTWESRAQRTQLWVLSVTICTLAIAHSPSESSTPGARAGPHNQTARSNLVLLLLARQAGVSIF